MFALLFRCAVCATLLCVSSISITAADAPFGLQTRTLWTTSKFRGRPEPPPPYRAEALYPKLRFEKTTLLAIEPNSNRVFVGERDGKIFVLPKDRQASRADLFLDCQKLAARLNEEGKPAVVLDSVYGLTFDPDFVQNRYCYVCYVVRYRDRKLGQMPDGTRVSRFRVTDSDPPRCEIDSELLVISWLHGGHNGGCLKFGSDGMLYISTGDGGNAFPPDGHKSGQDLSTLLAKILRIDVHSGDARRAYTIPADNPFVKTENARGEIWCYGVRNPWKMSFDRQTGGLWVGDVGWELWELVYFVNKGDNFGWSIVEGTQVVHSEGKRGPTPIVPAAMEIPHTDGASITGGFVYRGKQLPELDGVYVFGDWETRRVWGAKVNGANLGERFELIDPTIRIVDFAEDRDGEIFLLDHDDGAIYSLRRSPPPTNVEPFPRKLSETGIFRSVVKHEPADGVLPFSVNVELWSDHATADRWLAVPGDATLQLHSKAKPVAGSQFKRQLDFPRDTVLLKTLSLEMKVGDPASRRRVETQVLHNDGREWQAYTYEWNDEQTDATLVDRAGKNRELKIADAQSPGGQRTQTWRFSSRGECIRCHNPWSEYALACNVPQLNRTHDFGGIRDNQIRTYRHIGLLQDVVEKPDPLDPYLKIEPPRSPEALPRLTPPFDEATRDQHSTIADRARSYLHVNCGHCHRFNGGGSSYIYLQFDLPLADTKAVGTRPTQGTFGIHDAQLLAPGDPYRSVLYFRLSKTGPGHMPHLGSKIVDSRAVALVRDWIQQLPVRLEDAQKVEQLIALDEATVLAKEKEEAQREAWLIGRQLANKAKRELPNNDDLAAAKVQAAEAASLRATKRGEDRDRLLAELLGTPTRALVLAEALRQEKLPATTRALVMQRSLLANTDAAVRDLFEAFLSEDQQTKRLGDSINVVDILNMKGNADTGRRLFHESNVVQCRSCHQIDKKGTEIGPDLDAIGKKYTPTKLLESIVQPSLQIEPKYTVWLVETKAGQVFTGLKVRQDSKEIVLKDARNQLHTIAASDVEEVFPQTKSLMPDMLLRDFTAQQLADLLAYLATLKGESAAK